MFTFVVVVFLEQSRYLFTIDLAISAKSFKVVSLDVIIIRVLALALALILNATDLSSFVIFISLYETWKLSTLDSVTKQYMYRFILTQTDRQAGPDLQL